MRSSARSLFTTIRTEGAILPSELLERIAKGRDFEGLTPDSYHLLAGQKLNEVIERSWKQVLVAWRGFTDAREKSGDLDATGTSLTRERWLYPLFQELGFGRMPAERKAREIDGRDYLISHFYDHVPVHMVGYKILIDRRTPGIPGAAKTAPHSLVQEFLNRTEEHLWAIVSNGLRLRLLRDSKSLTRQAYVEFDLEAMLEGDAFADFRVLWLLCHQSRFEAEKPTDCWLEKWSKIASEQGVRALDKLRGGVEEAIRALGKGFLAHPANHELRRRLRDGDLDKQEYYRQVLRVVYRLLFLFVAEDRDLLLLPELRDNEPDETKRQRRLARARYPQHYGTQRLRSLSQVFRGTQHPDLWRGLQLIMRGLGQEGGIPALAVPALGSYLWSDAACPDLAGLGATPAADIANADLLTAVRALAVIEVEGRRTVVNYAHLRSEELGSVYESLLELHPNLNAEAGTFDLHSAAGNERKTTGSYYTPDSLVQCLLDSALEPVMDEKEALAKKVAQKIASGHFERDRWTPEEIDLVVPRGADPQEALALRVVELADLSATDRHRALREAALLGMRVCDPACGSGHFLIAAAHRIARRVARVRTGDEEPTPEALQHAMRDVVGRCLYGVDINPMALELAKVALWMEAIEPGKPLGFLDAHFQCGNALLGTTPDLIAGGLPDGAFTALTGDDKKFVSSLKRINKDQREGQLAFLDVSNAVDLSSIFPELQREAAALFEANADNLADVQRIAANYDEFRRSPAFRRARFVADLWCAAFVWPKVEPGEWKDRIREADEKGLPLPGPRGYPEPPTHDLIKRCAQDAEPWTLLSGAQRDMLDRLTDQFRFIHWHVLFADVFRTAAEGEKAQGGFDCMLGNPPWEMMEAKDAGIDLEEYQKIQHLFKVNQYEILNGRRDLYKLFLVQPPRLISRNGRLGLLVPLGVFMEDDATKWRVRYFNLGSVLELRHFQNSGKSFFANVHASYRFCCVTSTNAPARPHSFSTVASRPDEVSTRRRIDVTPDAFDLRLTDARFATIYPDYGYALVHQRMIERMHALGQQRFSVIAEFHASSDKRLLVEQPGNNTWVVLKNKNIHFSQPEYAPAEAYVPQEAVRDKVKQKGLLEEGWDEWRSRLVFRDIARNDDERTLISCLVPPGYVSTYDTPMFLLNGVAEDALSRATLLYSALLASHAIDFAVRPFVDKHIKGYTLARVPWTDWTWLVQSVNLPLSLIGCSLELEFYGERSQLFARDCGYDGPPFLWDEERRFQIRAELDAAFFHLYLGTPEEWTRTGSPELLESFPTPRHAVDYIMETFPIVKRKDEKAHGTYRTKDAILAIYDQMAEAIRTGEPYQTALTPPPGPPTDAEGNFIPMAQWDPANWPVHIHRPKEALVQVEVPVAVEEIPVPGMDFDFNEQLIPVGGVETFVYAVLPRLLTLESPMPFGIARDAALLASDPVAIKLLLNEDDLTTVGSLLPNAKAIDFSEDTRRVRIAEMTSLLARHEVVRTDGMSYEVGGGIQEHLGDYPIPAFLKELLPLAVKAAERLDELRTIYARERRFVDAQHQQAQERIDARVEAIA